MLNSWLNRQGVASQKSEILPRYSSFAKRRFIQRRLFVFLQVRLDPLELAVDRGIEPDVVPGQSPSEHTRKVQALLGTGQPDWMVNRVLRRDLRRTTRAYLRRRLPVIPFSLLELPFKEWDFSIPIVNNELLCTDVSQASNVLHELAFE